MQFGLGTVQFGQQYGISNVSGQTQLAEVKDILQYAAQQGWCWLDTAPGYGSSEQVLGQCLMGGHPFQIVTKTPKFAARQITELMVELLKTSLSDSLQKLQQESIQGLLFHSAADLLADNGELLWQAALECREKGLIKQVGVSIYTRSDIEQVVAKYHPDVLQVPINVFDQRLLQDGLLADLKSQGVLIHARSAFLQGLLLMPSESLPTYFKEIRNHFDNYRQAISGRGWTPLQAALNFINGISEIDVLLVGVNDLAQLKEICSLELTEDPVFFMPFALDKEHIVNPSRWVQ